MVRLNSKRTEHLLWYLIGIMLIIVINQLSYFKFFRIDLTEEKRYTISDATIELLRNLEDEVFIEVYLAGDLPAGFKRLQKSVRETLEEFKIYAGDNLNFTFTDPTVATSEKARNEFFMSLGQKGIQPTRLFDNQDGQKIEKIILPGALVSVGTRESGTMLLKGNRSMGSEEALNQSIENAEYELANAIRRLTQREFKKVAFLHGHRELDSIHTSALVMSLKDLYSVSHVNLSRRATLSGMDAIIVAQPKEEFSEADQYKIDQFIMKGGKAVFLLDILHVDMDSASGVGTVALPIELGLDNLFFKYGVRFNRDYILDLNCGVYPIVVGNMGDQPQVQLMKWPYFPILNQYSDHLIVKNSDATYARFTGTVDTVKADGIRKTPLIFTSENTRIVTAPVRVSLNDLRADLKPELFTQGRHAIAWLMEGKFTSVYKNRILPEGINQSEFVPDGVDSKIIVISDGDFIRNDFNPETNQPVELGFDPFTQRTFANGDFMVNALTYLLDEDGIINARRKEIKIRPLDTVKVREDKTYWQVFNLVTPIVLLIVFGVAKGIIRKRKYTRF